MERIHEDENRVTVVDLVHLYLGRDGADPDLARRAVRVEALPASWRGHIRKRLPPAP
jgi:hypothetical protein